MLAILHPNTALDSEAYRLTMHYLENLPGVSVRVHEVQGTTQRLTEIYLLGDTKGLDKEEIERCRRLSGPSVFPMTTAFWAVTKTTGARAASPTTAWTSISPT